MPAPLFCGRTIVMDGQWFTTTGKILYDPPRPTKLRRGTDWWCVVQLDNAIHQYYRWWLEKYWWEFDRRPMKRDYNAPAFGTHISVCRGEKPKNREAWKKRHGQRVTIEYCNVIRQTGDTTGFDRPDHFWFLDARFPEYLDIRRELGLRTSLNGKPFTPHITIARSYD